MFLRRTVPAAIVVSVAFVLSGCATATPQQQAVGKALRGGDVPVYIGGISVKYRVIKQLSETRRQICGPNYYDGISGSAWLAAAGKSIGADAVINYADRREGFSWISCGTFTATGTAVKFVK